MVSPDRPIRVGILGAGSAGRQHQAAIGASATCRLVGVYDPDPAATLEGVPRAATAAELIQREDIDLVAFCTPPGDRLNDALAAVDRGAAILLEKPPVASLADLDALVSAADTAGVTAGVMMQHRFALPPVPSTGAGATCLVEVSRPRPAERFSGGGWRSDPNRALGGISAHLGVHYLDLACQLLGEPVEIEVVVPARTRDGIDLGATGYARFATGGTLAFTVTSTANRRSERLAYLGPTWSMTLQDGAAETSDPDIAPRAARPASLLRTLVYDDVASAIAAGTQPSVAALQLARPVMTLLERIREAARG